MFRRSFLSLSAISLVSACSGGLFGNGGTPKPVMQRSYDIRALQFAAIPDIRVSEDEGYYPSGDVVWRGDPIGPRIPQIRAMFQDAFDRNRPTLNGSTPVNVQITLVRFHGVTDLTRLTFGGVYNVVFDMTIVDAQTGDVIEPTRRVAGDLDAPGGSEGRDLIIAGQTQKVRVTDFLTGLLRQQLV